MTVGLIVAVKHVHVPALKGDPDSSTNVLRERPYSSAGFLSHFSAAHGRKTRITGLLRPASPRLLSQPTSCRVILILPSPSPSMNSVPLSHVPLPPSRTSTTPMRSRGVFAGALSAAPACSINSSKVMLVGACMTVKSSESPCHSHGFLLPLTM